MRGDPERRNKKKGLHVLHRRRVSVLHASGSSRRSVRTEAEKTWEQMDDLLAGNEHLRAAGFAQVAASSRTMFSPSVGERISRVGRINYAVRRTLTETPGQLRPRRSNI